jgi:hypothetical protein
LNSDLQSTSAKQHFYSHTKMYVLSVLRLSSTSLHYWWQLQDWLLKYFKFQVYKSLEDLSFDSDMRKDCGFLDCSSSLSGVYSKIWLIWNSRDKKKGFWIVKNLYN